MMWDWAVTIAKWSIANGALGVALRPQDLAGLDVDGDD